MRWTKQWTSWFPSPGWEEKKRWENLTKTRNSKSLISFQQVFVFLRSGRSESSSAKSISAWALAASAQAPNILRTSCSGNDWQRQDMWITRTWHQCFPKARNAGCLVFVESVSKAVQCCPCRGSSAPSPTSRSSRASSLCISVPEAGFNCFCAQKNGQ